jgi:hypothetical protein
MHEFLQRDLDYVMRLDEVMWGCLLLAVTLIIHGAGLFSTMRVSIALVGHTKKRGPAFGMGVLILVALVLVIFHLLEVTVWAGFFTWKDAQPNPSSAFYNALINYTTLGAGYLPLRWRLLEGMLGLAGMLSFAFSMSTLLWIAQKLVWPAMIERQQGH